LLPQDASFTPAFNGAVSFEGDRAVFGGGALGTQLNVVPAGAAWVFRRDGDAWSQEAKLVSGDSAVRLFGMSISISGDTIAVGSQSTQSSHTDSGAVYVFSRDGSSWSLQATLVASDSAPGDGFGSVSLSGDTLLVGAWAPSQTPGAAYVFVRSGTQWTQQ